MATTYTAPNKLVGFADSVNATGRIGRSAFALFVDFAKVGAPAATGLVNTDIVDDIGALPENCVVRTVAAQIVKPIRFCLRMAFPHCRSRSRRVPPRLRP